MFWSHTLLAAPCFQQRLSSQRDTFSLCQPMTHIYLKKEIKILLVWNEEMSRNVISFLLSHCVISEKGNSSQYQCCLVAISGPVSEISPDKFLIQPEPESATRPVHSTHQEWAFQKVTENTIWAVAAFLKCTLTLNLQTLFLSF